MTQLPFEQAATFPRKFFVRVEDVEMWMVVHNHKEEKDAEAVQQFLLERVESLKKRLAQPFHTPELLLLAASMEVTAELLACRKQHQKHLTLLSQRLAKLINTHTVE